MIQAHSFDTAAHRLLDDLDARHDQLLLDLEALDSRVEQVLSQYRPVQPQPTTPPSEVRCDADDDDDLDANTEVSADDNADDYVDDNVE